MTDDRAPKILVAIHGVGDQLTNETARTVAGRVCAFYHRRASLSLGSFHRFGDVEGPDAFMVELPRGVPADVRFAEVYWAGIARKVVKDGYVLEDALKWAKTIVARVQDNAAGRKLSPNDCLLVENVLEELIDTVAVVDRLCFIAAKAGVFQFSLQSVLDNFVNDVQLVADFRSFRGQILSEFHNTLAYVASAYPTSDIYLVAHSEGTVVTLAGLLSAMANPKGRGGKEGALEHGQWLKQVKGLMTIGSPLDTHNLLWPQLWDLLKPDQATRWKAPQPIPWHNYYDHGDPIADSVKSTTGWVDTHYPGTFAVCDYGFTRYYFPGKAHIDYWDDEQVFGHFIEKVVKLPAAVTGIPKPPDKQRAKFVSYVVPYGLIGLLFFTAVFVLFRSVTDFLQNDPEWMEIVRDVAILAFLMAGMTVAVRMPRLTSMPKWRLVGAGLFVLSAAVYAWPILLGYPAGHPYRGMQDMFASKVFERFLPMPVSDWAFLIGAAGIVVFCTLFARTQYNRMGIRVLLGTGSVFVVGVVGYLVLTAKPPKEASMWPVLLALIAFLYLWWLAALLFDLVFVWHRYIRHSAALGALRPAEKKPESLAR